MNLIYFSGANNLFEELARLHGISDEGNNGTCILNDENPYEVARAYARERAPRFAMPKLKSFAPSIRGIKLGEGFRRTIPIDGGRDGFMVALEIVA